MPNVAYRAGGVAGVIRDGVDGLLVPCGDVEALAGALRRFLVKQERAARGSLWQRLTGWLRGKDE